MPVEYNHDHENEITIFAETNFRNARRRFGIKTDDRRKHMYILGKTGMGKTTLLENMVLSDVLGNHGVCYVDPHGDTAERILDYIPSNRINDVVYFNPADLDYPLGFNILETVDESKKHLVRDGLMGVFKKIWPDVWSPRMEYILQNCVQALLDYPGATLLGINRLLVDRDYRQRVIAKIRDPIVKTFWVAEYTSWSEKYATEAIAPVQNKVGQFLSASIIRNIVAQVKSTIDLRHIMDEGKILIVNLSKGRIGEDNMRLLGGMLITKLQLAAMERVDIPEDNRRDFYLYVDEFQNFATESFANILSEARKYRLNMVVAHQYIKQLDEKVCWAVFGNVGTIVTFRVGADDAAFMENEFMPVYTPEDLVNIAKFQVYLKLMVDGAATQPFSASTLPTLAKRTDNSPKIIAVSRERYASPRALIEEKVLRWSGMEISGAAEIEYPDILTEEERGEKEAAPEKKPALSTVTVESEAAEDTSEFLTIMPERLAAITKSTEGKKKDKPKFPHTCTRCGKVWEMPIQLDPTRPMYCAECLPLVRGERQLKTSVIKTALRPGSPATDTGDLVIEEVAPESKEESGLVKAFTAIEENRPAPKPAAPNRPRIVLSETPSGPSKGTIKIVKESETGKEESVLQELQKTMGRPLEKNKDKLTDDRAAGSGLNLSPSVPERRLEPHSAKRQRKKKNKSLPLSPPTAATPPSHQAISRLSGQNNGESPAATTVFKSKISAVRPNGEGGAVVEKVPSYEEKGMMNPGANQAADSGGQLTQGKRIIFD